MSSDPSPWADEPNIWNEETDLLPHQQQLELEDEERAQRDAEEFTNERLWELFANRLTREGSLIR